MGDVNVKSLSEIVSKIEEDSFNGPVYVLRKNSINAGAKLFLDGFKGEIAYAVKVNPDEMVLSQLNDLGIKRFDVASLREIESVRRLFPQAKLYFMNPIKSRVAIRKAYFELGVRDFSVDSFDELQKVREEIHPFKDITLFVRIASPVASAHAYRKFGIGSDDAARLLKECRKSAEKLGICFNLGSEILKPNAYAEAITIAASVAKMANVTIHILDVGGGFPVAYANLRPSPLQDYFDAIHTAVTEANFQCELICEPGRAIVAEAGSIIVRVELRKDSFLYLNDGRYGNLFDLADPAYQFPVRLHRLSSDYSSHLIPYSFFGPTCDAYDFLRGPFMLPEDVKEGDYIEIGQMGAYCLPMSTRFNGFGGIEKTFFTDDGPILPMHTPSLT